MSVEESAPRQWPDHETRAVDRRSLDQPGCEIVQLADHLNAAQQRINRKLAWFHDSDGMFVIKARVPAEAGQMFIKAVESACEVIPATEEIPADVSAETPNVRWRIDHSARRADAQAILAETFLAQGAAALKRRRPPPDRGPRGCGNPAG
jgi:hypothetical protein